MLLADEATRRFVSPPNAFLSHAWQYRFKDVVEALEAFGGNEEVFFWFDCFSIDEHATQTQPPEWWSTAFKGCVAHIGHTVMLLAPWAKPIPLTRSWCLWELFCTVDVGARFSVCLSPAEARAFKAALREDHDVFLNALAHINMADAEAGSPEDKSRILAAVEESAGGVARVNEVAMARMRAWVTEDVAPAMVRESREEGDLGGVTQVAILLKQLGEREAARPLYEAVIEGFTQQLGAEHPHTGIARRNLERLG